jgi:hypothetical protein
LLVASTALLAFASSERFVDNLNQEANGGGIDFIEVNSYFIGVSLALSVLQKKRHALDDCP